MEKLTILAVIVSAIAIVVSVATIASALTQNRVTTSSTSVTSTASSTTSQTSSTSSTSVSSSTSASSTSSTTSSTSVTSTTGSSSVTSSTSTSTSSSTTSSTSTTSLSTSTLSTTTIPVGDYGADYNFFIAPNYANIEAVRAWLMTPYNGSSGAVGFNYTTQLIEGDNLCGGHQNDYTLDDPNLYAAYTLDYMNAQLGISTNIVGSVRTAMGSLFTNESPNSNFNKSCDYNQATWRYNGASEPNRREFLLGDKSPYYPADLNACILADNSYVFNVTAPGASNAIPFAIEVPNGSCKTTNTGMALNYLAPYVDYLWLKGGKSNIALATRLFNNSIDNWTPVVLSNGKTGGYFDSPFGASSYCNSFDRSLGFWINMARSTGLWNESSKSRTVAQEVLNQLWYDQLPDGAISVPYTGMGCGSGKATSGEASSISIEALDPRLPSWFGTS